MTGSDRDYLFRSVMHNYLSDVALGECPWLNSSTICSFPEPWMRKSSTSHHTIVKNVHSHRPISTYLGTYHNDAFGTLYIHTQPTDPTQLEMQYGIGNWKLFPKHTADQFSGEGEAIVNKIITLSTIKFHFDSHHRRIHSVEVPQFESHDPPVFTKVTSDFSGVVIG